MTDHHDFGYPDDHHDDPLPYDDAGHAQPFDEPGDGHDYDHEQDLWPDHDVADTHEDLPAPPDEAAQPEITDDSSSDVAAPVAGEDVFPPALDVGDLPEPVDGFPWIDTGSLGVADHAPVTDDVDPVRPEELAEYAGTDLPPGVDPWAALADSDDPATSALARWWSQN
jgi:hypothetical protein